MFKSTSNKTLTPQGWSGNSESIPLKKPRAFRHIYKYKYTQSRNALGMLRVQNSVLKVGQAQLFNILL